MATLLRMQPTRKKSFSEKIENELKKLVLFLQNPNMLEVNAMESNGAMKATMVTEATGAMEATGVIEAMEVPKKDKNRIIFLPNLADI